MLEEFEISNDEIIPICVMATMSSGKSTFLNAILGDEVLPERNEACTARALAVLNIPGEAEPKAYIKKNDGKKYRVNLHDPNAVVKINSDESVEAVLIVKDISTITNTSKSMVFFDTPGVNNSGDIRHAKRTEEIIDRLHGGVIVYLLNATQLAANDDELLLRRVIDHVKRNPELKIIFVLNKIDMLDEEKESIPRIIEDAVEYIKDHGLEEIRIFPLSALSAKTFRMKLNGKKMTKVEKRHLEQAYPEYEDSGKSMLQYVSTYNTYAEDYDIADRRVSEYALRRAIENTGIVEIERQIEKYAMEAEQTALKNYKSISSYTELEGVYSPKRRVKNYESYGGKIQWICKKCGQINGTNQMCLHCGNSNLRLRKIN